MASVIVPSNARFCFSSPIRLNNVSLSPVFTRSLTLVYKYPEWVALPFSSSVFRVLFRLATRLPLCSASLSLSLFD